MSAIGKTAYLLDADLEIFRLDTPRFAPLRGLIIDMATTRGLVAWSAGRGVHLDAGGPGEPRLDVWVKKTVEAASDDYAKAGLRFRLDDASTSAGFSLYALRSKLGLTTVGTVGLDRVMIRAESDAASEQAGVHVGPFYIATATQDQDPQFDVELLLYKTDEGTTWSFTPGVPFAAASQPAVDAETEEEASDDDEEADEEEDEVEEDDETWIAPLHNQQLKIAAVLFALADGKANVAIAKTDLVRPLEGMDVAASALEKARVNRYDCGYFEHNQERGADARLHLTGRGLTVLKRIYTSVEGDFEPDALDTMVKNIHTLAGRRSGKKRAREVEVEAETEGEATDEDAEEAPAVAAPAPAPAAAPAAAPALVPNSLEDCAAKLTTLLERFEQPDDETTNDRLAEGFSNAIGEFFKEHKRVPSTDESNSCLKEARKALAQKVVLGSGRVKRQEVRQLLLSVEAAQSLPAAVTALVARAE